MGTFTYIASGKNGALTEGEMDARDEAGVIAYLEKHELFPLSIKEKKKRRQLAALSFGERLSLLDKVILARNLALMIKAGIGMAEAVDIMLEDTDRPALRAILTRAKADLEKGLQLSDALAQFPRHFPPVFINLLKAGEASGNLENALLTISAQLKKENDLKKKVRSAMAYPAVLVFAALGVVGLVMTVVLPRVSQVFSQAHIKLPLITRVLLAVSDFITTQWPVALVLLFGAGFLLALLRRSTAGRAALHSLAAKLPVVSVLMHKVALTRFCATMYSLLKAGVPIVKALEITAQSIGDRSYQAVLQDMARSEIAKGVSFGMALKRRPDYFPRLTSSMVVVGEKSGNLEQMLESLSVFYEEEVDNALKNLITFLEPALLLGIGLLVGTLALSIIIPIYQMIGTVR